MLLSVCSVSCVNDGAISAASCDDDVSDVSDV